MDFITADEKAHLEERLAGLKGRRKELSDRIQAARELGDLKENAEYHAAREAQGLDEAEIKRLERRLAECQVVDEASAGTDVVFLGSVIRIRDVDRGDEEVVRLVGESSGDSMAEPVEVTVSSPMGEALLKARVGETIRFNAPRGVKRFEILELL